MFTFVKVTHVLVFEPKKLPVPHNWVEQSFVQLALSRTLKLVWITPPHLTTHNIYKRIVPLTYISFTKWTLVRLLPVWILKNTSLIGTPFGIHL